VAPAELPIAIALGALAGLAAGEASRVLAVKVDRPLAPDWFSWLLAISGSLILAIHPAARGGLAVAGAEAALVGLLLAVLASDLRERAVYPAIVYPGVVLAIALAPSLGTSTMDALFGAAASTVLFGGLYAWARLSFGPGTLGAGDVSAAALLGAIAGASRLFAALTLVGLIGGLMALLVALRARSLRASFPYAPALSLAAMLATLHR
jgi:prepilin signal peptidase PulO-like enzyme (type II secretory pathway)